MCVHSQTELQLMTDSQKSWVLPGETDASPTQNIWKRIKSTLEKKGQFVCKTRCFNKEKHFDILRLFLKQPFFGRGGGEKDDQPTELSGDGTTYEALMYTFPWDQSLPSG